MVIMTYSEGIGADSAFTTGLRATATTDTDDVGSLQEDSGGNKFRFIKNVDTTAFVKGQVICWDSAANKGTSAYFSDGTRVVTAELMNVAGICVTAIGESGAATASYGWVQVWGLFQNAVVRVPKTNDIEEGSELIGENVKTALQYNGNAGAAHIYSNHIRALEVVTTDGTGTATTNIDVYIYCMQ